MAEKSPVKLKWCKLYKNIKIQGKPRSKQYFKHERVVSEFITVGGLRYYLVFKSGKHQRYYSATVRNHDITYVTGKFQEMGGEKFIHVEKFYERNPLIAAAKTKKIQRVAAFDREEMKESSTKMGAESKRYSKLMKAAKQHERGSV